MHDTAIQANTHSTVAAGLALSHDKYILQLRPAWAASYMLSWTYGMGSSLGWNAPAGAVNCRGACRLLARKGGAGKTIKHRAAPAPLTLPGGQVLHSCMLHHVPHSACLP